MTEQIIKALEAEMELRCSGANAEHRDIIKHDFKKAIAIVRANSGDGVVDLPLVNDAITKLIKVAAICARGEGFTSPYEEDHTRKAPKWLMRQIHKDRERLCWVASEIKQGADWVRNATAKLREAALQSTPQVSTPKPAGEK